MNIYVYAVVYQYRDIDGDWVDGGISRLYTTIEAARKYAEEKEKYAAHPIHEKLTALNKVIKEMTQYEAESRINTRLDRLLMVERMRGRK